MSAPVAEYPYDWDSLREGDRVDSGWIEDPYWPCAVERGYLCCRDAGHAGQHVAIGGGQVMRTWAP